MLKNTKVILFDHDDTLVSTIPAKWAQHKYIAKKFYDINLSDDQIRLHWGKPFSLLIKHLYQTDNIDMAMSYNVATRSQFPKTLFSDTLKTLKNLRKAGLKSGIVTATTRSSLENDFKTLQISPALFDYIQTEDDVQFFKPDPRVFGPALKWIEKLAIQPNEVLYVGDALTDLQAARGNGFHFIGVTTGLFSSADFAQHEAFAIAKLSDLLTIAE